jgi:ADP-heptose:LPS heptosyltransferase
VRRLWVKAYRFVVRRLKKSSRVVFRWLKKHLTSSPDRIERRQLGWERRATERGERAVLRGVTAARFYFYTKTPTEALRIELDGRTLLRVPANNMAQAAAGTAGPRRRERVKYAFNAWIDLSSIAPGYYQLQFYFDKTAGGFRRHEEPVLIEPPNAAADAARSMAAIPAEWSALGGDIEATINTAASVAQPARRCLFGANPHRVLVMRADQMGDFVLSVPAIQRLRALLPHARLMALVAASNVALAHSLGVFEEIFAAEIVTDPQTGRRVMPAPAQADLRAKLAAIGFDLAIDLCTGNDTQPWLLLSGAPHLVGFKPRDFPFLTFGIETMTREPVNRHEAASHAIAILSLVEALGAALTHRWQTLSRPLDRIGLDSFGIGARDRYVLLHSGARIATTRWPTLNYLRLADLVITQTDLKIVMMSDDGIEPALLESAMPDRSRLHLVVGRIAFDAFERLIAHCAAFVGNDSGPKHLAALRGAKVVSVHSGRINWQEWGQEGDGTIICRHVPCFGCGVEEVADCGKDLPCLTNIRPEEVFAAVAALL